MGLSKHIGVVLIDLSGTLHIEDVAIPGAIEALKKLRDAKNLKLKFVTNTTKESKQTLMERLTKIGFSINTEEVFTSLSAARQLLIKQSRRPFYMLSQDALNDFEGIPAHDPNTVLIGLAPESFDYENMTKALRLLLDGASLIGVHKNRYYKRKDGIALGPGAYISALEFSSGVKAQIVGKPEKEFFMAALQGMGGDPEETIMIGDDVRDDVAGAMAAGLQGCLVKTGKYRPNDENIIDPKPSLVAENFAEAVDIILEHNRKAGL